MTAGAGRTVTPTAFNRTASVVQGATTFALTYDDTHNRITQAAPSGTTTYLNDPISGAMSESVVSGTTTTWHDYLSVDGQLIAMRSCTGAAPCSTGATMDYLTLDHLGSIAAVTNDAAAVVERDAYDPWGRRRNINGTDDPACSLTSVTTRGFTSQEHMPTICEINANARIYDPTIARFMSVDPLLQDPFNGQDYDGYGYVENRPLSMIDPTGMNPCDSVIEDPVTHIETATVCPPLGPGTIPNPEPNGISGGLLPHPINFHPPPTLKPTTPPDKPTGPKKGDCAAQNSSGQCVYRYGDNGKLVLDPTYAKLACQSYKALNNAMGFGFSWRNLGDYFLGAGPLGIIPPSAIPAAAAPWAGALGAMAAIGGTSIGLQQLFETPPPGCN